MPQLLGLIFDLDGTLVDSAPSLHMAVNTLLASYGRRPLSLDEVKKAVGDGLHKTLERAFAATGEAVAPSAMPQAFAQFLHAYDVQPALQEQLYPHAIETLSSFRAARIKIGLCTNKLYHSTLKLIDELGMTELFDFVAGGDTFPVCKPHPHHVLGVAQGMSVPPENCLMIGDSLNDIRAAQAARITSIAVTHGYGTNVGSLGADAVIANFKELPDAIRVLGFDFNHAHSA